MSVYTQDQYNKLMDAIGQGALLVKYADKEVQYRSLDDMLRIKAIMEADLGIGANSGSRAIRTTFRTGLNGNRGSGSDW